MLQKLSQTLRVFLALILALFTNSVLPTLVPQASAAATKVFVCKYVTTPGDYERPSHIISVAVNNSNNYAPGDLFVDAQGTSFVLEYDNGQDEPDIDECPVFIASPTAPQQVDPCGPANAYWVVPQVKPEGYSWVLTPSGDPTGSLSAVAEDGYLFKTSPSTYASFVEYGLPTESGDECPVTKVPVPATPQVNDPCGAGNANWVVPANTAAVVWDVVAGELIAYTTQGYEFEDGTTMHNYGTAKDSGELCVVAVPATPDVNDPCGLDNATWVVPANTAQVTWVLTAGNLVAMTTADYKFDDGTTQHNYGKAVDSQKLCVVDVPAKPNVTDPCGLDNASWVVPADTASVVWTLGVNGHLVAKTTANYQFSDGTIEKDFGVAMDSGDKCSTPVPAMPEVDDPCGLDNAKWDDDLKDTNTYYWKLSQDGYLVVYTYSDYIFENGETYYEFGYAKDSGKKCEVEVPATPEYKDPCGLDNSYWITPDDVYVDNVLAVTWSMDNGHIIATTTADFEFPGGTTMKDYGVAPESGVLCQVEVPAQPGFKDPCGLNNATWDEQKDTDTYRWSLNENGDLVATIIDPTTYEFANGKQQIVFSYDLIESGEKCQVTPKAPRWMDACGTMYDVIKFHRTEGVVYKVDGNTVYHKFERATQPTHVITAEPANENYEFPEETTTEWVAEFTDENCLSITKSAVMFEDTDQSGGASVGDVMHWQVTVTNNGTHKFDKFNVIVSDDGATVENDGIIENLMPGESVTLNVTSELSAEEVSLCIASNTASFEAWYVKKHHKEQEYEQNYRLVSDDLVIVPMPNFVGTADASYELSCPRVLGETTVKKPTPKPQVLPATIPATGGADIAKPYMTIFAAMLTYGLVYFIQGRRRAYES